MVVKLGAVLVHFIDVQTETQEGKMPFQVTQQEWKMEFSSGSMENGILVS